MEYELFAVAAPGLERVVAEELRRLGLGGAPVEGGVTFRGSLEAVACANLWLRSASRVLLRLAAFDAPGRRELAARVRRLPLDAFVPAGQPIHVDATARQSRLYHTGLIAEVIHEALDRPTAERDATAPGLHIRIERDRCTISIDTSGELLHRRGYRDAPAQAPLRETLAAGLLLLCGYDGRVPFIDPMCGAGTLPIEAWLLATHRAPGMQRPFAFEAFPSADPAVLERLRAAARAQVRPAPSSLDASDIHGGSLAAARRNAAKAGAEEIRFVRADVAVRTAPAPTGWLVTNPPYGKRVGHPSEALAALGVGLKGAFAAWRAAVLLPMAERLPTDRAMAREVRLTNGGIPVRLEELRPR